MSKRILIVDLDDEARQMAQTILENVGYEVESIADTQVALGWWRERDYACVIFDPHLHLSDGHELHAAVSGDLMLRRPKLLYLCKAGEFAKMKTSLGIPSTLLLTKPFEFEDLVNRVQQATGPAFDD